MSNGRSFDSYKDEVYHLLWEWYGISRAKLLTDELIQTSYDNNESPRKMIANFASKIGLVKLDTC